MADAQSLQVPIGAHLFTTDALQKVLTETIPTIPEGQTGAVAATVDANGVKVGLVMNSRDGHWQAKTAFEHDWSGGNTVAGSVMASW